MTIKLCNPKLTSKSDVKMTDDTSSVNDINISPVSSPPPYHTILEISPLNGGVDYHWTVIDKLKLFIIQQINPDTLSQLISEHNNIFGRPARRGHGRITIELPTSPLTIISRLDGFIVDLNPNRYGCHNNVLNLLERMIIVFDPDKAEIIAIHVNVDLELPFEEVIHTTTVDRKRKHSLFFDSSKFEGAYYGNSKKDQIAIYDKALKMKLEGKHLTRFERRYNCRDRCPIHCLSDFDKLIRIDPFDGVRFHQPIQHIPESPAEDLKYSGYDTFVSKYGLQAARKKYPSYQRFYREFGRCLKPINHPDLNAEYKRRLIKYLYGGAD